MKNCLPRLDFRGGWLLGLLAAVIATPVIAETPNFGRFNLLPGFTAETGKFAGFTSGYYSLSAISNRDRNKQACIGFADPNPDHIMILEKNFANLRISVNSGGNDTTLLIQGPDNNTIRCGDDTDKNKDASIVDQNWKKGIYRVWVGTFKAGVKHNYTLTVQEL
ncbi:MULTISPECIES: hypothetical protein [unclassified Anabaena]|uniref:hypothetical protein n=1 Tax=unclassified Anabaena TaxID=2619674 RepID=UPI00082FFA80|nr:MULTISPECIES: hypothetical protein [unclassified Anabaena]